MRIIIVTLALALMLGVATNRSSQAASNSPDAAPGAKHDQHEQSSQATPGSREPAAQKDRHHVEVNERGDTVMGFSHLKTTHHFLLKRDGGVIEVAANDSQDTPSRDQIRMHLRHIATLFKAGDFNMPMLTHGKVPPGATEMARLKAEISYSFEETEWGGRVRISAVNTDAISAVHEFLRFQITDHETGDPLSVEGVR